MLTYLSKQLNEQAMH
ncbi:Protein of unknown function [Bacillus mycoides]|nr:Protein of unknown function [Bacillus mycoides]